MVRLASFVSAVALTAAAGVTCDEVVQDVNGYKYVTSGPSTEGNLRDYWFPTSQTALSTLKSLLGPQGLKDLLKPEIAKGDEFWHDIVSRSTGRSWKPAEGRTIAFVPEVSATNFTRWFSSARADLANNNANAEHYFKQTTADPATGALSSEIIEGWGGVTTHFRIPNFAPADRARYPMLRELPEFPIQFAGDKTLMDGTVFGVLHIAVRDVAETEFPNHGAGKGIEVYAAVWYGDAADDDHLEMERQHMIIEEINLTQRCRDDIVGGLFP